LQTSDKKIYGSLRFLRNPYISRRKKLAIPPKPKGTMINGLNPNHILSPDKVKVPNAVIVDAPKRRRETL